MTPGYLYVPFESYADLDVQICTTWKPIVMWQRDERAEGCDVLGGATMEVTDVLACAMTGANRRCCERLRALRSRGDRGRAHGDQGQGGCGEVPAVLPAVSGRAQGEAGGAAACLERS